MKGRHEFSLFLLSNKQDYGQSFSIFIVLAYDVCYVGLGTAALNIFFNSYCIFFKGIKRFTTVNIERMYWALEI